MKKTKSIEQFLEQIENLKPSVDKLKAFETETNSSDNTLDISEFKSFSWLENSPVCTKIVDLDFNLLYMSRAGTDALKIEDITQYYGKPYPLSFYSDSFKTIMADDLNEVKTSGEPITQEAKILDIDGNEIWYNSTLIPIYDINDSLDYFLIVSSNITARKQAELDLINSEEKLIEALEITRLGSFVFDDSTDLFETSVICDDILGIDKSYIRNIQGWIALVHPEDYENAQLLLDSTNLESVSSEFRIIRPKDQKIIWILGLAKLEFNSKGVRNKITGTIQDITERKLAEEKLNIAQNRIKNTYDLSPSIIASVNINKGYYVEVNQAVTRILGYSIKEFTSRPFIEFIHPDDIQKTIDEIEEKLKCKNVVSFENRYLCKDGSYKWLDWKGTLPDENGIITAIGTDITSEKEQLIILDLINDVAKSILGRVDIYEIAWVIVNKIAVYLNSQDCVIYLVDRDNDKLEQIAASGDKLNSEYQIKNKILIPIGDGIVGSVAKSGISEIVNNTSKDDRYILDDKPRLSEISVPIVNEGKVIGVIDSEHLNKNYYSDEHLKTLESIARLVSIQIKGALNYRERKATELKNEKLLFELEDSKKYLSLALEGSGLGIWDWWFDDNSVKFDYRWAKMLGLNVDEIPMNLSTWESRVHPDDIEKCFDDINKYIKGETNFYENIHRMKHADGRWIYILDRGRISEYDEAGNPKRFTGTHSDITESVINQKTKLEELNRVISSSPSCLKIINKDGILVDMNQRGLDILDVKNLSELLGKSIYDVIADDFKEDFIDFNKRICSGESGSLKFVIINSKDENVWVESYAKPYKMSNGEIAHIAITNDITERVYNEKILKENEEFLNLTGEIAKVGGWEVDLISNKVKWSKETKSIHELSQDYQPDLEEAINFYHEDDQDLVRDHVTNAIENGKQFSFEARIITTKGNLKYVKAYGRAVFENNKCNRLYGAFQDISDRKIIELELENYRKQLETENVLLKKEISLSFNYEDMVYSSEEISDVLTQVEQVAQTDATVLILGETGTGKELIAKAIHNTSSRKNNSLIRVNCAAIPSELIESELFGHAKGSFTGAIDNRIGKFELADGGTIFLDEIGELPLALQPKLLRAIQEGEIEPIGSSKMRKLNVRIIAATNKDLKKETETKNFREDLYFRLNVFPITIPPLRKRIEDIPVLIDHFVNKYSKKHGKVIKYITDTTLRQMKSYSWPGNIRELENVIERAVIISNQDLLMIQEFDNSSSDNKATIKNYTATLDEVQRNHIIKVLNETHWKIDGNNGASKLLGLKPSTLRDRMKKLGIKRL